MDISSLFLENLTFGQWVDFIKRVVQIEGQQRVEFIKRVLNIENRQRRVTVGFLIAVVLVAIEEDDSGPNSASTEDFDGGDDVFCDAPETPVRSKEHLSPKRPSPQETRTLSDDSPTMVDGGSEDVEESPKECDEDSLEPTVLMLLDQFLKGGLIEGFPVDEVLSSVALKSTHKAHRFSAELDSGILELLKVEHKKAKTGEWALEWERDGITMHSLPIPGNSIPVIRGHGVIGGGFTVSEVFSVIRSPNCRKKWDPRFEFGLPLAVLNSDDIFAHSVQKGSFPVAARDFIVTLTTRRPSLRELFHVTKSVNVETGDVPGVVVPAEGAEGRVRAQLDFAGWILKASTKLGGVEAVYLVQVDPKGTLPTAIVRMVQNQTPLAISNISQYLATNGPIPFVLQVPAIESLNPTPEDALTFINESWNWQNSSYDLILDSVVSPAIDNANETSRGITCIPLAIPKHQFEKSGCTITVLLQSRGGKTIDGLVVKHGFLLGPGMSPVEEAERRDQILKGVVSNATLAVVMVWVEVVGQVEENTRFGIKIHLARGSGEGQVVVNGEPSGPIIC
ncbi:hypothetical protein HDU98_010104 [Podochytrium sp. JEL0797]|nr:hypothetical protein HDU98_010104 [Podochytrium sp. JEL0797]